jgi:hypothetical protein
MVFKALLNSFSKSNQNFWLPYGITVFVIGSQQAKKGFSTMCKKHLTKRCGFASAGFSDVQGNNEEL